MKRAILSTVACCAATAASGQAPYPTPTFAGIKLQATTASPSATLTSNGTQVTSPSFFATVLGGGGNGITVQVPNAANYGSGALQSHLDAVQSLYLNDFVCTSIAGSCTSVDTPGDYSPALDRATTKENALWAQTPPVRSVITFGPYYYTFNESRTVFPNATVPDSWLGFGHHRTFLNFNAAGNIVQCNDAYMPAWGSIIGNNTILGSSVTGGCQYEHLFILGNRTVSQNALTFIDTNDQGRIYDVDANFVNGHCLWLQSSNGANIATLREWRALQINCYNDGTGGPSGGQYSVDLDSVGTGGSTDPVNNMSGVVIQDFNSQGNGIRIANSRNNGPAKQLEVYLRDEAADGDGVTFGDPTNAGSMNSIIARGVFINAQGWNLRVLGNSTLTGNPAGIDIIGEVDDTNPTTYPAGCIDVEGAGGVRITLTNEPQCGAMGGANPIFLKTANLINFTRIIPAASVAAFDATGIITDSTISRLDVDNDPVFSNKTIASLTLPQLVGIPVSTGSGAATALTYVHNGTWSPTCNFDTPGASTCACTGTPRYEQHGAVATIIEGVSCTATFGTGAVGNLELSLPGTLTNANQAIAVSNINVATTMISGTKTMISALGVASTNYMIIQEWQNGSSSVPLSASAGCTTSCTVSLTVTGSVVLSTGG